jgi:hypothetical protein
VISGWQDCDSRDVILFTSHVFLSLIDHKCITTVLFLLLVWFFSLVSIRDNSDLKTWLACIFEVDIDIIYSFNRTKSTKFGFQVLLSGVIAKPGNNQGLESISSNVRIVLRFVCRSC